MLCLCNGQCLEKRDLISPHPLMTAPAWSFTSVEIVTLNRQNTSLRKILCHSGEQAKYKTGVQHD